MPRDAYAGFGLMHAATWSQPGLSDPYSLLYEEMGAEAPLDHVESVRSRCLRRRSLSSRRSRSAWPNRPSARCYMYGRSERRYVRSRHSDACFFKVSILGAGSVIHAVHSNNMSDMGGLKKHMPITYRTMLIGALALSGIPPLAGFFSKDEILATFNHAHAETVFWLGAAAAMVTAFYTFRMIFLTFHGTYLGHGHPHESPRLMTTPLVILAIGAVAAGWVNIPGVFTGFHHWVEERAVFHPEEAPTSFDMSALIPGLIAAVLGILLAYFVFYPDRGLKPNGIASTFRCCIRPDPEVPFRRSLLGRDRPTDQGPIARGSTGSTPT